MNKYKYFKYYYSINIFIIYLRWSLSQDLAKAASPITGFVEILKVRRAVGIQALQGFAVKLI